MKLLPPVGRPNGGRLGNRKETTGCVTCKKRKIKCDESKPFCNRCTSSARQCGGYTSPFARESAVVSCETPESTFLPPSPSVALTNSRMVNSREHQAFRYFVDSRTRAVAGPFDVELWSDLIPQLSETIPALRHAAMAVGALLLRADDLQSRGQSPDSLTLIEAHDIFAVEQYHKAIQLTLQVINDGRGNPLLASTTCVLFFCVEALQGREHEALRLFERGRTANLAPSQGNSNDTLASAVESTFSRLGVQWSMFNDHVLEQGTAEPPELGQPIGSISQAQSELISLVTYAFELYKAAFRAKWDSSWDTARNPVQQGLELRQQSISGAFEHWRTRFAAYHLFSREVETPRHSVASSTLLLWYHAMSIWVAGSLDRSQMIYDQFLPRFSALIAEAARALDNIEKEFESVSFTFELGVIPPLYVLVLLCRDPVLRRQALGLLRRAPAQEGLWRRAIILQACERLIELEEGSDGFTADITEDLSHMVVAEERRCKVVKIGFRATSDVGRWGNYVEFYSKPHGLNEAWSVHEEFFAI
ncbi:hypothetical protein GQ53DRAFT_821418 [Thozetella sp. PMI_491]|nr:hypothetical protein GQ53DRAFT_821418 [Thozetella sp. PMI_491]